MRRSKGKTSGRRGAESSTSFGGGGSSKKRAKPSLDLAWNATPSRRLRQETDEHIDSSDDDYDGHHPKKGKEPPSLDEESGDDDEQEEALETKRVRLAREYLQKLEGQSADSSSSDDASGSSSDEEAEDGDRLGRKLQKQRQKREGTFERILADKVARQIKSNLNVKADESSSSSCHVSYLRGHDLTPTCVALTAQGSKAVSGSKDHSVLLWDIENQSKITSILPHWKQSVDADKDRRTLGQVLSVACSDDDRYASVGKRDATVKIFDLRAKTNYNLVHTFQGHKGPVTCLTFRSQSLQLFSGSDDRCIRHYNLAEMLYLETLYGHQFGVTSIDCWRKERPISVGQDRTARAWKLELDTHLIFRGGSKMQAADCISLIKDDWFITGHQDGTLALWMTEKKKAVTTVETAHGTDEITGLGRNVTSVGCLPGSDLAASGSTDGHLRFWKVRTGRTLDERGLDELFAVPLPGYINAISFGPKAKFCVAAVGQEHRLGRWNRIAGAKNRLAVVKLYNDQGVVEGDELTTDERSVENDNDVLPGDESKDEQSSSSSENDNESSDSRDS